MNRIKKFLGLVLVVMISAGVTVAGSEEKTDPLPAGKKMVYSWGKDDESWLDMGYPYTNLGRFEVTSGEPYPAAIYGRAANIYAHTINLQFQLERPRDMVFVIDFYSEQGSQESTEELKVLLNGQFVRFIDLKLELKEEEKRPEQKKEEKRYEVIELAAEEGENIVTLDMSHNPNWFNCWFDSILLYEPEVEEEAEESSIAEF